MSNSQAKSTFTHNVCQGVTGLISQSVKIYFTTHVPSGPKTGSSGQKQWFYFQCPELVLATKTTISARNLCHLTDFDHYFFNYIQRLSPIQHLVMKGAFVGF